MGSVPYPSPSGTGQWAKDFLTYLGDPVTPSNVSYLQSWQGLESPSGYGYNPLGTEQTAPGSVNANSAGVQAFTSWGQGFAASAQTLANTAKSGNEKILELLHRGNATLPQFAAAQSQGSWSTGAESSISTHGVNQNFHYGGPHGMTPGAPGVAGPATGNPTGWFGQWIEPIVKNPVPLPGLTQLPGGSTTPGGGVIHNVAGVVTGPFSGVTKWISHGAADITFVVFGLVLVVVGLSVTFERQSEAVAGVAAKAAAA